MVIIHLGLHFTLPSIQILCPKKCKINIHSRLDRVLMRTFFYLTFVRIVEIDDTIRFFICWNCVATYFSFHFFLFFASGIYVCVECDHPLFSSHAKYEHQTPWPAFSKPIRNDSLKKVRESEPQESSNCYALKVSCGKCGNGLGHEFVGDGPGGKGSRFWIFSHSLKFVPK